MTRILALAATLSLIGATALAQQEGPIVTSLADADADPRQIARDEAAVYAVIHRIETAWREGSAEDVAVNFAPTAVLVSFADHGVEGREEIEVYYQSEFAGLLRNTVLDHTDVTLRFIGPDTVLASYESLIDPAEDAVRPACSPYTTALVTRIPSTMSADGEWVINYFSMVDAPASDCVARTR